jgi:hypothetical protein
VRLELLLLSATVAPLLPAVALNITEQLDVPGVLIVPGLHVTELTTGSGGFRVRAALLETVLSVAVTDAVWLVVTLAAVAVKLAEVDPADTTADEATVRLVLLLLTATVIPPLGAAPLSVTVQLDVPGVVRDEGTHPTELTLTVPPPPPPLVAGLKATVVAAKLTDF